MDKLICNESSHAALEFFEKHFDEFKPVKSFTTFFDNENFMLTNYTLSHASIHAVVENQQGKIMEFSSLNCGYGGEGPRSTACVLQMLGIEKEKALDLILHDGLQINFNANASSYEVRTDVFFNGNVRQKRYCGCNLSNNTLANVITHDVCMINPEKNNFTGLLNCLHVMQPVEFEYSIGKYNFLIATGNVLDLGYGRDTLTPDGTDGVNLIIRGKKFDVICFIDYGLLKGTLNAVYTYLTKHNLFAENHVGDVTAIQLSKRKPLILAFELLVSLFKKGEKPFTQKLSVSDKELKKHGR